MRKSARYQTNPSYSILVKGGRFVDINVALITYRCEECLSKLKRHNSGLVCVSDPSHKHFIHRSEAAQVAANQAADLAEVMESYTIKDGQIVFTGENNNGTQRLE